ncbi:MAG: hypothetical protein ACR2GR_05645 [Rhodothermales bacterium]
MTQQDAHSKQYRQAREAFDHLKIEDRAVFLLEATVSTVARGVEDAGRVLANELDRMFSAFRQEGPEASRSAASPGPAEPPTAKKTAPRTRKKKRPSDDEDTVV